MRTALLGVGAVVFLLAYFSGSLDHTLAPMGLNYRPCARILLTGSVLCGDELTQWCEQTAPLRQLTNQSRPDACI